MLFRSYPPLYPWLLSWVIRWEGSLEGQITAAVWTTALLSCWFLASAWFVLRRFAGLGAWPALFCVGMSGFHTVFAALGVGVMSDMLFMALAMTSALVAEHALAEKGRRAAAVAAGALAGLSVVARTLGVPVAAGLLLAALYRRAYHQAALIGIGAAPFVLVALIPGLLGTPPAAAAAEADGPVWRQTWLYYTSYWEFWKLSVPSGEVLRNMMLSNVKEFLEAPASLCLFSAGGDGASFGGALLSIVLTAGVLAGVSRLAAGGGYRPIHFVFVCYAAAAILWNFAIMHRLLAPFLPLLYAGLWMEGKHLAAMIRDNLRNRSTGRRALAAVMGLAALGAAGRSAASYLGGPRGTFHDNGRQRATLRLEREQAYEWIRQHTAPETRFLAWDDVLLHLHTGRQAIWPMALTTAEFYRADAGPLQLQLERMMDVARHVGARYWLDEGRGDAGASPWPLFAERLERLKSVLPRVFESRGGQVRIYDLRCVQQPQEPACAAAVPTLFPAGLARR